jgi:hypothetical protein
MTLQVHTALNVETLLTSAGVGRRLLQFKPKQVFFSQGSAADAILYLQTGRDRLAVVSHTVTKRLSRLPVWVTFSGMKPLPVSPAFASLPPPLSRPAPPSRQT